MREVGLVVLRGEWGFDGVVTTDAVHAVAFALLKTELFR